MAAFIDSMYNKDVIKCSIIKSHYVVHFFDDISLSIEDTAKQLGLFIGAHMSCINTNEMSILKAMLNFVTNC